MVTMTHRERKIIGVTIICTALPVTALFTFLNYRAAVATDCVNVDTSTMFAMFIVLFIGAVAIIKEIS